MESKTNSSGKRGRTLQLPIESHDYVTMVKRKDSEYKSSKYEKYHSEHDKLLSKNYSMESTDCENQLLINHSLNLNSSKGISSFEFVRDSIYNALKHIEYVDENRRQEYNTILQDLHLVIPNDVKSSSKTVPFESDPRHKFISIFGDASNSKNMLKKRFIESFHHQFFIQTFEGYHDYLLFAGNLVPSNNNIFIIAIDVHDVFDSSELQHEIIEAKLFKYIHLVELISANKSSERIDFQPTCMIVLIGAESSHMEFSMNIVTTVLSHFKSVGPDHSTLKYRNSSNSLVRYLQNPVRFDFDYENSSILINEIMKIQNTICDMDRLYVTPLINQELNRYKEWSVDCKAVCYIEYKNRIKACSEIKINSPILLDAVADYIIELLNKSGQIMLYSSRFGVKMNSLSNEDNNSSSYLELDEEYIWIVFDFKYLLQIKLRLYEHMSSISHRLSAWNEVTLSDIEQSGVFYNNHNFDQSEAERLHLLITCGIIIQVINNGCVQYIIQPDLSFTPGLNCHPQPSMEYYRSRESKLQFSDQFYTNIVIIRKYSFNPTYHPSHSNSIPTSYFIHIFYAMYQRYSKDVIKVQIFKNGFEMRMKVDSVYSQLIILLDGSDSLLLCLITQNEDISRSSTEDCVASSILHSIENILVMNENEMRFKRYYTNPFPSNNNESNLSLTSSLLDRHPHYNFFTSDVLDTLSHHEQFNYIHGFVFYGIKQQNDEETKDVNYSLSFSRLFPRDSNSVHYVSLSKVETNKSVIQIFSLQFDRTNQNADSFLNNQRSYSKNVSLIESKNVVIEGSVIRNMSGLVQIICNTNGSLMAYLRTDCDITIVKIRATSQSIMSKIALIEEEYFIESSEIVKHTCFQFLELFNESYLVCGGMDTKFPSNGRLCIFNVFNEDSHIKSEPIWLSDKLTSSILSLSICTTNHLKEPTLIATSHSNGSVYVWFVVTDKINYAIKDLLIFKELIIEDAIPKSTISFFRSESIDSNMPLLICCTLDEISLWSVFKADKIGIHDNLNNISSVEGLLFDSELYLTYTTETECNGYVQYHPYSHTLFSGFFKNSGNESLNKKQFVTLSDNVNGISSTISELFLYNADNPGAFFEVNSIHSSKQSQPTSHDRSVRLSLHNYHQFIESNDEFVKRSVSSSYGGSRNSSGVNVGICRFGDDLYISSVSDVVVAIDIIDLNTRRQKCSPKVLSDYLDPLCLCVISTSVIIVGHRDGSLILWNIDSDLPKMISKPINSRSPVTSIAAWKNSQHIALTSTFIATGHLNGVVRTWLITNGNEDRSISLSLELLSELNRIDTKLSSNTEVHSRLSRSTVKRQSTSSSITSSSVSSTAISYLVFHCPKNSSQPLIISYSNNGLIKIWDLLSGYLLRTIPWYNKITSIGMVLINENDSKIFSSKMESRYDIYLIDESQCIVSFPYDYIFESSLQPIPSPKVMLEWIMNTLKVSDTLNNFEIWNELNVMIRSVPNSRIIWLENRQIFHKIITCIPSIDQSSSDLRIANLNTNLNQRESERLATNHLSMIMVDRFISFFHIFSEFIEDGYFLIGVHLDSDILSDHNNMTLLELAHGFNNSELIHSIINCWLRILSNNNSYHSNDETHHVTYIHPAFHSAPLIKMSELRLLAKNNKHEFYYLIRNMILPSKRIHPSLLMGLKQYIPNTGIISSTSLVPCEATNVWSGNYEILIKEIEKNRSTFIFVNFLNNIKYFLYQITGQDSSNSKFSSVKSFHFHSKTSEITTIDASFIPLSGIGNLDFLRLLVDNCNDLGSFDLFKDDDGIVILCTTFPGMLLRLINGHEFNTSRSLLAVSSLFVWAQLLYFMQPFYQFGYIVNMIVRVSRDIRGYLTILAVFLIGFSQSFWLLTPINSIADDNYTNSTNENFFSNSLLTTYLALFGQGQSLFLLSSQKHIPSLYIAFLVVFILFMGLIMLNLLIALMNYSFSEVKDNHKMMSNTTVTGNNSQMRDSFTTVPNNTKSNSFDDKLPSTREGSITSHSKTSIRSIMNMELSNQSTDNLIELVNEIMNEIKRR
eukprot:gene5952-8204_t